MVPPKYPRSQARHQHCAWIVLLCMDIRPHFMDPLIHLFICGLGHIENMLTQALYNLGFCVLYGLYVYKVSTV